MPHSLKTSEEDHSLQEKLAHLSIISSNFMMTGHSPALVLTKGEDEDEVMLPVVEVKKTGQEYVRLISGSFIVGGRVEKLNTIFCAPESL